MKKASRFFCLTLAFICAFGVMFLNNAIAESTSEFKIEAPDEEFLFATNHSDSTVLGYGTLEHCDIYRSNEEQEYLCIAKDVKIVQETQNSNTVLAWQKDANLYVLHYGDTNKKLIAFNCFEAKVEAGNIIFTDEYGVGVINTNVDSSISDSFYSYIFKGLHRLEDIDYDYMYSYDSDNKNVAFYLKDGNLTIWNCYGLKQNFAKVKSYTKGSGFAQIEFLDGTIAFYSLCYGRTLEFSKYMKLKFFKPDVEYIVYEQKGDLVVWNDVGSFTLKEYDGYEYAIFDEIIIIRNKGKYYALDWYSLYDGTCHIETLPVPLEEVLRLKGFEV